MKKILLAIFIFSFVLKVHAQLKYAVPSVNIKTDFFGFSAKVATKVPYGTFSEKPDFYDAAWLLGYSFDDYLNFPFSVKIGTLSYSGGITKLSNPPLSTSVSVLSSKTSNIYSAKTSISSSDGTKPKALAINFFPYIKKGILQDVNAFCFFDENGKNIENLLVHLKIGKKTNAAFSVFSGEYEIKNETDSWFSETPLFLPQNIRLYGTQLGFFSPFLKIKETFCTFPKKKEGLYITASTENTFIFKDFLLNVNGFFANGSYITTGSSRTLKTKSQIRINPQYTFYPKNLPCKIKTGGAIYIEEKTDSNESKNIKEQGGIEIRTKKTDFSTVFTLTENTTSINTSFYNLGKNKFTEKLNINYDKNTKKSSYALLLSQNLVTKNKKSAMRFSENITLLYKEDSLYSLEAETGISLKNKTKFTSTSLNFNLKYKADL